VTASTYRSLAGAILFMANTARPDIAYAASFAARSMAKPTVAALVAIKRLWAYLAESKNRGIVYHCRENCTRNKLPHFVFFVDSDWDSDLEARRSTTGQLFMFAGAPVYYSSNKQALVTLSSTESEYVTLGEAGKEAVHIQSIIKDLDILKFDAPLVMMEDNKGAIDLAHNPKFHARTKHIDIRHHWIRDLIALKVISIQKVVDTKSNLADGFTKPLTGSAFAIFASLVTKVIKGFGNPAPSQTGAAGAALATRTPPDGRRRRFVGISHTYADQVDVAQATSSSCTSEWSCRTSRRRPEQDLGASGEHYLSC
jgi:hypothetical protein